MDNVKPDDSRRWPHVVVITGPTASGKTALALDSAERLGAHIISADSRQVYRGIPITTAVPTAAERSRVPHHLIEFLDLDAYYSAAMFEADALRLIGEAAERGDRHVVVAGGSMMYIDALCHGIDDMPTVSDAARTRVHGMYADGGLDAVLAMLDIVDPDYASTVDRRNTRRVMHALEISIQTGQPYSTFLSRKTAERPFKITKVMIDRPRDEMFSRINARVDAMVAAGMEDEARSVFHLRHLNSLNTIGFKEWFAHFDGIMERETAIARIAKNTRVYAKKQLTWYARDPEIIRLTPSTALDTLMKVICKRDEVGAIRPDRPVRLARIAD